jgi:hypothetical protein
MTTTSSQHNAPLRSTSASRTYVQHSRLLQSDYRVSPRTSLATVIPPHQKSGSQRRMMSNKTIYGCKLLAILDVVASIELTLEHAPINGANKAHMDWSLLPLTLTMKLKLNRKISGTTWNRDIFRQLLQLDTLQTVGEATEYCAAYASIELQWTSHFCAFIFGTPERKLISETSDLSSTCIIYMQGRRRLLLKVENP